MNNLEEILPRIKTLTFDCYGTLVDWHAGLNASLTRVLGDAVTDQTDSLYSHYVIEEARLEADQYRPYREILAEAAERVAGQMGVILDPSQAARLGDMVPDWPPFPDTVEALRRLKERFRLGVLSNVDRDIFAQTAQRLGVQFDFVITAEDVQAYKPAHAHFEHMLGNYADKESVLHVAQSLYHDGGPAGELGLAFVWINRYKEENATTVKPAGTFADLASLAEACTVKAGT